MNTLFRSALSTFTRRDFLKLSGQALLSLFALPASRLPERGLHGEEPRTGRVCSFSTNLYSAPDTQSEVVNKYSRDELLSISQVVLGNGQPEYNRIWYGIAGEGYVHSGNIQPVETALNEPFRILPENGWPVEVTVPFTESLWSLSRPNDLSYRLYYSSIFWASKVIEDEKGQVWYWLEDDQWKPSFYARAEHLRLLQPTDYQPISPEVPLEAKRLDIRLADQVVIAYEEEQPVFMTKVSTGAHFSHKDCTTPSGLFITNRKRSSRHMLSDEQGTTTSFDLPGVPWVTYLTKNGISFHGTYWHNDFGRPRSHGCINLPTQAARWIYCWTAPFAPLGSKMWAEDSGTVVNIE